MKALPLPLNKLNKRDALDLNPGISRKPRRLNRRPCRLIRYKIAAINLIHRRKIIHIRKKNRSLYYALERRSGGLKHRGKVFKDLLRLLAYILGNKLAGCRIYRDLA